MPPHFQYPPPVPQYYTPPPQQAAQVNFDPRQFVTRQEIEQKDAYIRSLEQRLNTFSSAQADLQGRTGQVEQLALHQRTEIQGMYSNLEELHQNPARPQRTYTTKLLSYNPHKETFRSFLRRFEVHSDVNKLDAMTQKFELVTSAIGAIDHILVRKDIKEWKIDELLAECKERMCPDLTETQIEEELYDLEVREEDKPEDIMRRVEEVLAKADPTELDRPSIQVMQCEHFMRLIHTFRPMFTYVRRQLGQKKDPLVALRLAKEYMREKGDENRYTTRLIEQRLSLLNLNAPSSVASSGSGAWKPFHNQAQPGVPKAPASCPGLSGIPKPTQEVGTCAMVDVQPVQDETSADFMARFLSHNDKVPMSEIIKRLNTSEQMRRDLQQCGVPDKFKNKGQNSQGSMQSGGNPRQAQSSGQSSNSNRQYSQNSNRRGNYQGNSSQGRSNQDSGNRSSGNKGGNFKGRRFREVQIEVDGKLQQFYEPIEEDAVQEEPVPESLDLQLDENAE